MFRKMKQHLSILRAKRPSRFILYIILLVNIIILLIFTIAFHLIQRAAGQESTFLLYLYRTVNLVFDAGNINEIITRDIEWTFATIILAFLSVSLITITMVSFTSAVIGYLTNKISQFVEQSNAGAHALELTEHTVILNWNSRAVEIINDMLFTRRPEKIVILVQNNKELIQEEIHNRLLDTVQKEKLNLKQACAGKSFIFRIKERLLHKLHNHLTVIVRQGDVYQTKQLNDISLHQAKTIIILGQELDYRSGDSSPTYCPCQIGHCITIKILMQVAEITAKDTSRDNQQIVVETSNEWMLDQVQDIIKQKQRDAKCNIIPVPVNRILGQILSQISIMPALSLVYSELFSYRGAEFFSRSTDNHYEDDENKFITKFLETNEQAIPLTIMKNKDHVTEYFIAERMDEIKSVQIQKPSNLKVNLNNENYTFGRSILILGHNSKMDSLLEGFNAYVAEWQTNSPKSVFEIVIVDDEESIKHRDYYENCRYVKKVVQASTFDKASICSEISAFIDGTEAKASILILSDDTLTCDEADTSVFTHLIYVQSTLNAKRANDPQFDTDRIDVVVELSNPKNADVIASYNVDYIIISNRYISRLINHLGEKESLYSFLSDILTYDPIYDGISVDSKEIYIKQVGHFFSTLPPQTTAFDIIRAVYSASPQNNKIVVIGYIPTDKSPIIFTGKQQNYRLALRPEDNLIVFCDH